MTTTRKKVFLVLLDKEPQTMREVIAGLPDVDRVSVYRTIAIFEKLRVVERLQMGWKYKLELTDEFGRHHHHITCRICGRMQTFPANERIEGELAKLAKAGGFTAISHQLEVCGVCESCRTSKL
jgi:Fe2+ or Zn2+ uptake regulation protein